MAVIPDLDTDADVVRRPSCSPIEDDVVRSLIDDEVVLGPDGRCLDLVRQRIKAAAPLLPEARVIDLEARILARVVGLGPLQPLVDDPEVTDVMVNGDGAVWVERAGRIERAGPVLSSGEVRRLIERIVGPLGRRIDRSSPLVDARLPDGSRVHAVIPPLAVDGPCLSIRRFSVRPVPLSAFASEAVGALLAGLVSGRRNVLVSGGTGAGKTTLLNALATQIAAGERVITIEDAAELRLPGEHTVRLEAREANTEGVGAVSIRDLVRTALRMRPDRIVIGEVRSGEALDLLQAMNTGHEGSLSTCHANSPADAIRRLEVMVLMSDLDLPLAAIREQVAAALDAVVQVARAADGSRRVVAVDEVEATLDADGRVRTRALVAHGRVVGRSCRPDRDAAAAPLAGAGVSGRPGSEPSR
jgi:pilus assembly protein CpaF